MDFKKRKLDASGSTPKEMDVQELKDQLMSREIYVPNDMVGYLIGSNGRTLMSLQNKSGATIQLMDVNPDVAKCLVVIVGTRDNIQKADKLIRNKIKEEIAALKGKPPLAQQVGNEVVVEIRVPAQTIDSVNEMGLQGFPTIKDLTGAAVTVIHEQPVDGCQPSDRKVRITGTKEQIGAAIQILENQAPLPPQPAHPPPPPAPRQPPPAPRQPHLPLPAPHQPHLPPPAPHQPHLPPPAPHQPYLPPPVPHHPHLPPSALHQPQHVQFSGYSYPPSQSLQYPPGGNYSYPPALGIDPSRGQWPQVNYQQIGQPGQGFEVSHYIYGQQTNQPIPGQVPQASYYAQDTQMGPGSQYQYDPRYSARDAQLGYDSQYQYPYYPGGPYPHPPQGGQGSS